MTQQEKMRRTFQILLLKFGNWDIGPVGYVKVGDKQVESCGQVAIWGLDWVSSSKEYGCRDADTRCQWYMRECEIEGRATSNTILGPTL